MSSHNRSNAAVWLVINRFCLFTGKKTRALGQIVRITGTLANPNIFAWIVLQMSIIVFLFEEKKIKKWFFVIIGFILVVFAGSRSLLILFPAAFFVVNILKSKKKTRYSFWSKFRCIYRY